MAMSGAPDGPASRPRPARSSVLGLLGPNGSGKTTAVSILSTALRPDSGHASVYGFDVRTQGAAVRRVIGFAGQFAAVDANLTGRENLALIGRLSRLPRRVARDRASELLASFGLTPTRLARPRPNTCSVRQALDRNVTAAPSGSRLPMARGHWPGCCAPSTEGSLIRCRWRCTSRPWMAWFLDGRS